MVISCTGLIKHRCSGQILLEMSLPLPGCSCQLFGATLPSAGYILLQYVNEFSGRSTGAVTSYLDMQMKTELWGKVCCVENNRLYFVYGKSAAVLYKKGIPMG